MPNKFKIPKEIGYNSGRIYEIDCNKIRMVRSSGVGFHVVISHGEVQIIGGELKIGAIYRVWAWMIRDGEYVKALGKPIDQSLVPTRRIVFELQYPPEYENWPN